MAQKIFKNSKIAQIWHFSLYGDLTPLSSPFFSFKALKSVSEKNLNATALRSNAGALCNDGKNMVVLWGGADTLIPVGSTRF